MTRISVGQRAELVRKVTLDNFRAFAALSGDNNPIHSDPEFAATTRFGLVIAPGLLIGSFISAVIANDLPGPGSIYISQSLKFLKPVYEGETVRIVIVVVEIPRDGVCQLSTTAETAAGVVLSGEALVMYPK